MKRKVLAGIVVFGLSVLIAGTGSVFAGENETPAFGVSQYGISEGDGGVSAEYWQAVETGSLPGNEKDSRLLDTGVDPARWAESQGE